MKKKECTSINNLAQKMNLSPSTISRALSDMPGVSRKRASEIRHVAKKMGYHPNPYHRKYSSCIALVFPESKSEPSDEQFRRRQVYLAERYATSLGKYLFVSFIKSDGDELPPLLVDNRVDGVLLSGYPPRQIVDLIRKKGLHMVGVNDLSARLSCDCVIGNPVPGAQDLILKLLENGHSNFGFIITGRQYPTVDQRFAALEMVLQERGIKINSEHVVQNVSSTLDSGAKAVRQILKSKNCPDALIFTNDWTALGGMIEIYRHGLRIPEDISIAAFDNTANCEQMQPKLTSVDLNTKDVIEAALDRLTELISGKVNYGKNNFSQIEISSSLVWRDSCRSTT